MVTITMEKFEFLQKRSQELEILQKDFEKLQSENISNQIKIKELQEENKKLKNKMQILILQTN